VAWMWRRSGGLGGSDDVGVDPQGDCRVGVAEPCRDDVDWDAGSKVRLRLNMPNATFTKVQARQFALHEVLGHGLQGAAISSHATEDAYWVRLSSVHGPQQVLSDGQIAGMLTDRSTDPLLRTYMWAYVAGIDWFTNLADTASKSAIQQVLHAAYRAPLTPTKQPPSTLARRPARRRPGRHARRQAGRQAARACGRSSTLGPKHDIL
jgi:hypothetical protein